ncbi:MAG TPA: tripartite tricarboxylate transporter substrate binding protein [Xanthobacteraceae bacterium]|jgi:tripartite-type tricarboxylate transporter receptor subunit TctC|nr:tripartite tricarboxylate transporter substrate binding protein [Xanthobacteraceae bacterium]
MQRALIFRLIAILVAVGWSAPPRAVAADASWPQRTVRFILPLGAGSGSDIGARLFAERLAARWGQPVVVENRPGGDAFVAITAFLAAHDEHTLLLAPTSTFTAHTILHRKLPYDPRDLLPIARITNTLISISVPSAIKVGSLKELVGLVRSEPGRLNRASITGALDIVLSGFLKESGLEVANVPYRDPVQAVTDLAENRIQIYTSAYAIVQAQEQAGTVKVLSMTNQTRAPTAPNIPTAAEAGYPALTFDGLVGLFGPPGMSAALRERIAADIRAVAAEPGIEPRLIQTGQILNPGTPAEFGAAVEEQTAKLAAIAHALDLKPED